VEKGRCPRAGSPHGLRHIPRAAGMGGVGGEGGGTAPMAEGPARDGLTRREGPGRRAGVETRLVKELGTGPRRGRRPAAGVSRVGRGDPCIIHVWGSATRTC